MKCAHSPILPPVLPGIALLWKCLRKGWVGACTTPPPHPWQWASDHVLPAGSTSTDPTVVWRKTIFLSHGRAARAPAPGGSAGNAAHSHDPLQWLNGLWGWSGRGNIIKESVPQSLQCWGDCSLLTPAQKLAINPPTAPAARGSGDHRLWAMLFPFYFSGRGNTASSSSWQASEWHAILSIVFLPWAIAEVVVSISWNPDAPWKVYIWASDPSQSLPTYEIVRQT